MANEWGPLGALVGEWEAEGGLDTAYSQSQGEVLGTPYLEKLTFKPFGPVENGSQSLYGLDYKTAMWRADEDNPFHTEVGYWLWDAATGEILHGFVVPRGITVLAGGTAAADATTFTLSAAAGDPQYSIGENKYLAENASTLSYTVRHCCVGRKRDTMPAPGEALPVGKHTTGVYSTLAKSPILLLAAARKVPRRRNATVPLRLIRMRLAAQWSASERRRGRHRAEHADHVSSGRWHDRRHAGAVVRPVEAGAWRAPCRATTSEHSTDSTRMMMRRSAEPDRVRRRA
jgi:hypothetical protein